MDQEAETSNSRRAKRAERTVRHYSRVPGYKGEPDYEADIADFLTDLRHFCAGAALDFEEMVERSRRHYEAERKEGPNTRRTSEQGKKPTCPNCSSRLEYEPDQDGACDWFCPHCGWHQHVPAGADGVEVLAQRKASGATSKSVSGLLPGVGNIDLELLKRQAALLGKVLDKTPLTDRERSCLEGLWEFVHRVADCLERHP